VTTAHVNRHFFGREPVDPAVSTDHAPDDRRPRAPRPPVRPHVETGVRSPRSFRADSMGTMDDLFADLQRALGDDYALERETTGTAIARVFIARERVFNRAILVSVLAPDAVGDLDFERFVTAAGRTAAFDHPGIIPPLALGAIGGLPYVITPYVPGVTLRARLVEDPPLSLEEVVAVLRDVASALDYAHTHDAVHLHLTPDQILLSQKAARLSDFGIERDLAAAQRVQPPARPRLTGSRDCLAPEQLGDDATTASHLADVFAWGCVAYEMLTGVAAFHRAPAAPGAAVPLDLDPAPITLTRRDVPAALVRVIMRCLSTHPASRPSSAANLVQRLGTIDVSERAIAERALTPAYLSKVTRPLTAQQPVQPAVVKSTWWDRRKIVAAAASIVVVLGMVGRTMGRDTQPDSGPPLPPAPRPTVMAGSVVVLPMVVPGNDSASSEIGAGFSDEIAGILARGGVPTLGRLSGGALRHRGLDPEAVARELGAASTLAGTMHVAGDSIHLDLTLRSWEGTTVRWSATHARSTADLFAISSDVARNVAAALRGRTVTPSAAPRVETADAQAHLLLLRGVGALSALQDESTVRAAALFTQAIARDPQYARAHGLLALTHALPAAVDASSGSRRPAQASAAASRALAIDSTIAEAHQALAFVRLGRAENRAAERLFKRAIALDSTLALGWSGFGLLANHLGDYALARTRFARARRLDGAVRLIDVWTAQVAFGEGKDGRAEAESRLRSDADSASAVALATRVDALVAMNRAAEAVALLEAAGAANADASIDTRALLAYAYACAGQAEAARAILVAMRDASGGAMPPMATLAATVAALGDVDSAIRVLGRAVARRDPTLVLYGRSGRFDALRNDARGAKVFAGLERW
jgi:serine/threonine protein kinase/TolB-like protein/tetratricopeptide (TPR) repeat protein